MSLKGSHSPLLTTLVLPPQVLETIVAYWRFLNRGPGGELGGTPWRS